MGFVVPGLILVDHVDAKHELALITVEAVFADDVETVVQLEGTAQPNTDITMWRAEDPLFT